MTAASAPVRVRPRTATRRPGRAAARLLLLELRHSPMPWLLPLVAALFWATTYRKVMALPPQWYPRAGTMQIGALLAFASPVIGAAAWTAARDRRRHIADLVAVTARPRWTRLLAPWAATTCWALAGYLACVAVVYGRTAGQATWGGPLWWPVIVGAAALPAFAALGFAAGTLLPSRLTAPLAAITIFFVLALSTQLIVGSQSYWSVSPIVAYPWDNGPDASVATFYPYLPDLSIDHVMFLVGLTVAALGVLGLPADAGGRWLRRAAAASTAVGLLAAGTATVLGGTGRLDVHGMIAIPALHDAASDRPLRYTPVCRRAPIPVCLNPAYAGYLPAVAAALRPVLSEVAGLPGAPARISQAVVTYRQGAGNDVALTLDGPILAGRPPVYRLLLPNQVGGPTLTTDQVAAQVRSTAGPGILASVVGRPSGSPAQQAVLVGLIMATRLNDQGSVPGSLPASCRARGSSCRSPLTGAGSNPPPGPVTVIPALRPGTPAYAAARRFAALPAPARHAWLLRHLAALRAGQITPRQLP
jgi:hypothetical protein